MTGIDSYWGNMHLKETAPTENYSFRINTDTNHSSDTDEYSSEGRGWFLSHSPPQKLKKNKKKHTSIRPKQRP